MSTKNSTLVTNFEASPQTMSKIYQIHGRERVAQGTIALATTDLEASDIVMLAPIPTGASITSIQLASDDMDSDGTPALLWNLGLYTTAGVEVDLDCYGTDLTLGQAATAFTEYRWDAANITTCGQQIWEDGGQTEDPFGHYYVALTIDTVPDVAVAGDLSFIIKYVVD